MEKVKWGVIGPGIIAQQFAKDIKHCNNAIIQAVASNSQERADQYANTYRIPNSYEGYQALYEDPEIDAIYVATTHNFHLANSMDAIMAGKAVLCEKPLTDNLSDSQKLIDLATSNKVYLMEGLWTYFLPAIQKVQKWINEGKIGKVNNLKTNFGFKKKFDPKSRLFNPELSGGVLLDMGIYPVAMAWLIIQDDPDKHNIIVEKATTGVDYDVNMQLVYRDKRVSNLHASFKYKLDNYCYIFGEDGYIVIPDFWRSREAFLYKDDKIIDSFNDNRNGLGFEFQIQSASDDILNDRKESRIMPHDYSIKLQSHMKAIMAAF